MSKPTVALFGYNSSAFTQKMRMALKLRQIPYSFVVVPSMMPRPILTSAFALTYRKIPVLAIDQDIYCDTSLELEILNTHPKLPKPSKSQPSLHPNASAGHSTRTMARLFGSHYTDQPWYRIMTGLVPGDVWRSCFGTDRAGLIGHPLDADKLEAKIPQQMANLERDLSILEPMFADNEKDGEKWILHTATPGAADIHLFFMFKWGRNIAKGVGVNNLTGGEVPEMSLEGIETMFTEKRYPGLWRWFERVEDYWNALPDVEMERVEDGDEEGVQKVLQKLNDAPLVQEIPMLPTPQLWNEDVDAKCGLILGERVSVAPGDTGRDDPVHGTLLRLSAEEVVISPAELEKGKEPLVKDVRIHFPRVGFLFKSLGRSNKL